MAKSRERAGQCNIKKNNNSRDPIPIISKSTEPSHHGVSVPYDCCTLLNPKLTTATTMDVHAMQAMHATCSGQSFYSHQPLMNQANPNSGENEEVPMNLNPPDSTSNGDMASHVPRGSRELVGEGLVATDESFVEDTPMLVEPMGMQDNENTISV